jgi:succinylglutamate desuccinylase
MIDASLAPFAAGDFNAVAAPFANAGWRVTQPAAGLLQIVTDPAAAALVLSVGVHGDETAPIEIVAALLQALAAEPHRLAVNLLLVIGNIAAIAACRRFIEVDLNRLFIAPHDAVVTTPESVRAAHIMTACGSFFAALSGPRWHLDLHTTIRPSSYPAFAIIPAAMQPAQKNCLIDFLADAAIDAAILNQQLAPTFSAFTAQQFGASSATCELGQVGRLGENRLQPFAATSTALARMLREGPPAGRPARAHTTAPRLFTVTQELIRHSSGFRFCTQSPLHNFMRLGAGSVVATDGTTVYRVDAVDAYLVFPNPQVQIGQRAGLIVVPTALPY